MKKYILGLVISLILTNGAFAVQNKVYAIVNGEKITQQTIAIALKDPRINFSSMKKKQQKEILKRIIEQKILSQEAVKTDVVKDPVYKQTLNNLKQDLALQVWMQQMSKKVKVSDVEAKKFYKKNKGFFKVGVQLKAKHILVKTKKQAQDIIKTLSKTKNLKSKFISLAKAKSTGPTGKNGGELGWFTLEKMVPNFSKSANALKVGTITKVPVKTQFGYHIIFLEDRKKASTVSFEKAKFQIKQQIGKEKFIKQIQKIVDDLKKKSKIIYK
jgi:parvulin-like peptidyl-prolyl isomerase